MASSHRLIRLTSLLVSFGLALGCGDDGGSKPDGPAGGDGGTLFPCSTPGKACNAHDPCAIDPVCGEDRLCHPTRKQDCDDGLPCTEDTCEGKGKCSNVPAPGKCALSVKGKDGRSELKCFDKGAVSSDDPCKVCAPSEDRTRWSGGDGNRCNDENLCTKNDICQAGICKGTYYGSQCADGLQCTDDICDGKGGCKNKLKANYCKIGKLCVKDQETDAAGCKLCDVKKSTSQWITLPDLCAIGSKCFASGTKDSSGCGVCDPKLNKAGWSVALDACQIGGQCIQAGQKDTTGCGVCDPKRDQRAYSAVTGKCLIAGKCRTKTDKSGSGCGICLPAKSGVFWSPVSSATVSGHDFEAGASGFAFDAAIKGVGWQIDKKRAHGGSASLYYGDPKKRSYDNGAKHGGGAKSAAVRLAAGKKAALFFWTYLDVETSSSADVFEVRVGSTVLWKKDKRTVPLASYRRWIPVEVDLSAYAGQTIQISFVFDSVDDWANVGEGVYIDDVSILGGC